MIGVVVWTIFQIQPLVTASSQLERDSRACLHLYLANIYISSIIHISTHDLLVNLLSLTRHHQQMDISSSVQ